MTLEDIEAASVGLLGKKELMISVSLSFFLCVSNT